MTLHASSQRGVSLHYQFSRRLHLGFACPYSGKDLDESRIDHYYQSMTTEYSGFYIFAPASYHATQALPLRNLMDYQCLQHVPLGSERGGSLTMKCQLLVTSRYFFDR